MDNNRNFFRIKVYNKPVFLKTKDFEKEGLIKDVSGNGIAIYLTKDVKIKYCEIKFKLEDEDFHFDAKLVRKKETEFQETVYAFKFIEPDEKMQSRLTSILLRIDAIRRTEERTEEKEE